MGVTSEKEDGREAGTRKVSVYVKFSRKKPLQTHRVTEPTDIALVTPSLNVTV